MCDYYSFLMMLGMNLTFQLLKDAHIIVLCLEVRVFSGYLLPFSLETGGDNPVIYLTSLYSSSSYHIPGITLHP